MIYQKVSLLLLFMCCLVGHAQFEIPEKPSEQTSVYDYVNLLPDQQKNALEQKLIRYSDSTSTQIVIAIIKSTEGEEINYLGANWLTEWGIGQKGKDNGILIILARDDRKIGINTGYGVEGSLTDAMSRRIIQNVVIPHFKQNNYYGGLNDGADAIFQVLNGEFKEERTFDKQQGFPLDSLIPFIIFFVILIILSRRKNKGGGKNGGKRSGGLDLWDIIILSNMGRSGHSGGGFGGGGSFGGGGGFGGGFGGGMGGGGGASGGW
ncbi:TPM domain-containing protein [Aurantibacter crassamenti]|uniref:TPM domain-containing protein n=1 Tax=Aurantibacter crassamenti TaxID=1837375 RepID=UPI0019394236|nr:TPM domain-containing protein [Aurantibacter crassamenti]MBM1105899.1 TPM domain-containing protein [Aurantibacter crassamenti]